MKEFRRYHIPAATMKRKADEFRTLQQGSMSVEEYTHQFMELARYAPEEVDDDEKKQDMFKKELSPEFRTLLTPQIYPDFTEKAKAEERRKNKRKFLESKAASRTASRNQGTPAIRHQDLRPQCSIGPSHK